MTKRSRNTPQQQQSTMDLDESEDLSILNGPNSSALFSSDQLNNEEITDDRPIKRIRGPYRARKARIVRKHDPNHNLITEDMEENEIHKTLNRMPHCDLYDWEVHYEALLEYYREHGHCNVPFKLTYQCTLPGRNEDGTDIQYLGNLGRWLDRQRQTKKGHRPEKLRQDREAMLQKLVDEGKLAWTASHKKDTWYRSYLALLEFGKINGHCNVRAKYEFECDLPADLMPDPDLRHYSGKLGTWVEHQRQSKKGKGTPLFADREMLLQQLVDEGKFLWDASEYSSSGLSHQNHDHKWPIVYGALLEYGKVHGDYNVPINCHFECNVSNPETDEIVRYSGRLGRWLYAQRVAKRGDSRGAPLGPDKEALLQQLVDEGRLWWDPPSQKTNYSTGAAPVRITTTTTTTTTTISNATSTERRSELSFLGSYVALLEYGRLKGDYNIQGVFSGSLLSINNENLSVTYTGDLLGWLEKQRQARKGYGTKLPAEYRSLFHRLASKGKLSWESSGASNATATLTTTTSEPTVGYCAPIMNNNAYTQNWQNHYLALLEYENENGHCNVPIGCIYQCMLPDGTKFSSNLGVWLHSQRISQLGYFHRPPLQPEHAALLQELVDQDKLVWDEAAVHITNLDIENWDIHYAALLEYDQEYGHSNVPTEFTYHCELSNGMKYQGELGQWLNIQRRLKQEQEHSVSGQSSAAAFSLHPQHMSHLQILVNNGHMSWEIAAESPILTTEEVQRICWLFHSAALVQFEREMGHCNVPVEMTYQCELVFAPEETARFVYIGALGRWLADEKVALAQEEPKIHCNSLVHRRRPALNVSDRHEFFQSFISQGKLLFDASTIGQGNNSKLSDVHEISWLAHYLALLEFCRVHGHCDVPFDHVFECELPSPNTNPRSTKFLYVDNLGTWLCKQKLTRHDFAGKFLPERELLLQQLVGEGKLVWTILSGTSGGDMENSWDDHYAALIEYSKVKGHCNPPFTLVFDCKLPSGKYRGNLGIWVYKQRFARLGLGESLSNDQKEKLQHLVDEENFMVDIDRDVIVNGAEDSLWLAHYAALTAYGRQFGHCNVPYKAYFECILPWTDKATNAPAKFSGNLGAWLMNQRQSRKLVGEANALLPEREALLQQLVDQGKLVWDELVSESSQSQYQQSSQSSSVTPDSWNLTSVGVHRIDKSSNHSAARALAKTTQRSRQVELDSFWDRHHNALLNYGQVKGHYNIPPGVVYENESYVGSLGNWLHQQRLAKSGVGRKLNARQESALLKLEESQFSLSAPVEASNSHITTNLTSSSTATTGAVVSSSTATTTTTAAATKLPTEMNELTWEKHFAALLHYRDQNGHCNVPFDCVYSCVLPEAPSGRYTSALGVWLYQQRVAKSSKHNRLSPTQEHALQKLVDDSHLVWETAIYAAPPPVPSSVTPLSAVGQAPVPMSPHGETSWMTHYAAMLQYCKEHGHCNVPKGITYDCIIPDIGDDSPHGHYVGHLGSWLCYQRRLKKKDKSSLLPERSALLQQLVDEGFLVWDVSQGKHTSQTSIPWKDHYLALLEYAHIHGHCNVPRKDWFDCTLPASATSPIRRYHGNLGEWLHTQKAKLTTSTTSSSADRIVLLRQLVDEGKLIW